jgi:hypothetical protein
MRPNLLVDQTLDLVTRHPVAAGVIALAAAIVSWLITRSSPQGE